MSVRLSEGISACRLLMLRGRINHSIDFKVGTMITPNPATTPIIIGVRSNARQDKLSSKVHQLQYAKRQQQNSSGSRGSRWDLVRGTTTIETSISESIPLPAWHVQKTRSEIQLDDSTLQAEYEDARMCIRLVAGMQTQCIANGGIVHPKTRHCLREVLRTKAAKDEIELEECRLKGGERVVDLVLTDATITLLPFSSVTPPSPDDMSTAVSHIYTEEEDDDDDCVFSLEL